MQYIIYDFEFNTAFRIDRETKRLLKGDAHPDCPQEIIEIGAVRLNQYLEMEDTFHVLVRPVLYRKMHPKIRKKTRITGEELEKGVPFTEAIGKFRGWIHREEKTVMASWGKDDLKELDRNCLYHQMPTDWYRSCIDVQQLCSQHLQLSRGQQIGLQKAVVHFGISQDHSFHQALHDAWYTALIFREVQAAQSKGGRFHSPAVEKDSCSSSVDSEKPEVDFRRSVFFR